MRMFAGLDVGFKRTAVCVVDEAGRIVWRGVVDTHPEALSRVLQRWGGKLAKIGVESGSMTPWLVRELAKVGFPTVCMDARAAADAVKSRRVKSDKADAYALAEMLRTGWYRAVYVKSEDSHRLKAMLGARDQLVRAKRALGNQVRGLLRPFGIRLPSRQGTKKFAEAAHRVVRRDNMLHVSVTALLEVLAAIEGQIARLDEQLKELARRSPVCWRLMSVPGVGPIVALAFMAAIEDINRFRRMRSVGAYLGLTTRRYQSSETDVVLGISRQGDAMARHYLYEAANVLLTTVRRPSGRSGRASRWRAGSPSSWDGSGKIKPTSTLCLRNAKGYPRRSKTSDRRIVVIGLPRGRPGRTGEHGTCWLPVGSFRCV
jgi:transposase